MQVLRWDRNFFYPESGVLHSCPKQYSSGPNPCVARHFPCVRAVHICIYIYIYVYVQMHVCSYTYTHTCIYIMYMYICLYTIMFLYICTCTCTCTWVLGVQAVRRQKEDFEAAKLRAEAEAFSHILPGDSYAVPFWVVYYPEAPDTYSKKELGPLSQYRYGHEALIP